MNQRIKQGNTLEKKRHNEIFAIYAQMAYDWFMTDGIKTCCIYLDGIDAKTTLALSDMPKKSLIPINDCKYVCERIKKLTGIKSYMVQAEHMFAQHHLKLKLPHASSIWLDLCGSFYGAGKTRHCKCCDISDPIEKDNQYREESNPKKIIAGMFQNYVQSGTYIALTFSVRAGCGRALGLSAERQENDIFDFLNKCLYENGFDTIIKSKENCIPYAHTNNMRFIHFFVDSRNKHYLTDEPENSRPQKRRKF